MHHASVCSRWGAFILAKPGDRVCRACTARAVAPSPWIKRAATVSMRVTLLSNYPAIALLAPWCVCAAGFDPPALNSRLQGAQGPTHPRLLERLEGLQKAQQFRIFLGSHECDLGCSPAVRGTGEIFVPHLLRRNTLYCMPVLALHYIRVHGYR